MTGKRKDAIATPGEERPGDEHLSRRLAAAKDALERIRRGEAPSAEELAAAPLLRFWCVVLDEPLPVLQGVVTGHPRLPDGHLVATSPILWLAPDRTAARTVSRWYRLGVPLTGAATTPQ
jgi:hypothetical protein